MTVQENDYCITLSSSPMYVLLDYEGHGWLPVLCSGNRDLLESKREGNMRIVEVPNMEVA